MTEDTEQQTEVEAPEPTESEAKARRQGWRPKDEYRGSDDKWVDADSFLKRSDEELPVMRERVRAMERKLAEQERTTKQFAEHHARVQQIAHERAMAEVKKERREALAIGDADGFEQAEDKLEKLKEDKPGTKKEVVAEASPVVDEWIKKNTWFNPKTAMGRYAEEVCTELQNEDPDHDLSDVLKQVTKEVMKRFPEKFANAKRAAPPAVEGATTVASSKGSKGYPNLPAAAKIACDKFIKQGLIKNRDEYLKYYDWEE
jgi:hypothetical protein